MKTLRHTFAFVLLAIISSCSVKQQISQPTTDDGKIDFNIMAINDVYEIAPLENGKVGGMARVGALKKQMLAQNKNTILIHGGDFVSPSLIGNMKIDGMSVKGKQMIEAMNVAGVDLAVFGNHEFDIDEDQLLDRLKESEFTWLGTNVKHVTSTGTGPFKQNKNGQMVDVPETYTWTISDADGTTIKVGFFGATIDTNKKDYVDYEDWTAGAKRVYAGLKSECDLIIGLTHLEAVDDGILAKEFPDVPLFAGGHDHHNMIYKSQNTVIAKADANAKTAYAHSIHFDKSTKKATVLSGLVHLNETIAFDPETDAVIQKWVNKADASFKEMGFDPTEVLAEVDEPLDGKESSIRHMQTNLGLLITKAMSYATEDRTDCAILNSGSIRVDDELSSYVTQYDILRALPYSGEIWEVKMKGDLLLQMLDSSISRKGNGAFLQMYKIAYDNKTWKIGGKAIEKSGTYLVALNDFLLSGYDYPFAKREENPDGIISVVEPDKNNEDDLRNDLRKAIIAYLKTQKTD